MWLYGPCGALQVVGSLSVVVMFAVDDPPPVVRVPPPVVVLPLVPQARKTVMAAMARMARSTKALRFISTSGCASDLRSNRENFARKRAGESVPATLDAIVGPRGDA